ncbi:hypothetical protein N0V82_000114 [Gnomoniopsis sp. IMI 355080]|nr:hypothetical protein N0V82_000114 [Gnomoniopsis sp. IMI 355080]
MAALVSTSPGMVVLIGYYISSVLYTIYFHPLSSFPGPWFMGGSRIPYTISQWTGRTPFNVLEWHKKYGPVVRIAPDELAFSDPRAWKDMHGHRAAGEPEFSKVNRARKVLPEQPVSLITAPREEHGRLRRQMAHGFSDRSLREQQPIIKRYIDMLVQSLYENCEAGSKAQDMVKWYNYTTFDIIGDLAFGEAFGCLELGGYHPWVPMIFSAIKCSMYHEIASFFPWFKTLIFALIPRESEHKRRENQRLTKEKLTRRMNYGGERPDLIEGLLRNKDELGLTFNQLQGNATLLIIAGSETTATLLSGVTYLLGMHTDALAKLTEEVRTAFKSEDEIDYVSVSNLPYMVACLEEALRIYPPAPLGITIVSMAHWAVYHSEEYWTLPHEFHPERWLGDPRFAKDVREIHQPFHVGPRNCLGKNLAYIEMRLILTRVLWNFDIKLADECKDWIARQKIFLLWEKPPLKVYLTPRLKN